MGIRYVKWWMFLCFFIHRYAFAFGVSEQVRHYTVKDGLQTNEVRQIIELPNGQILVNCEGMFGLFNGKSFTEIACDYSLAYPLSQYRGYAHRWQGDSLLWLRDFYRLYLFDAHSLVFRYDVKQRIETDDVLQQLANGKEVYENPADNIQMLADSIGAHSKVACAITDRQGGIWLGTQTNGLYYVAPSRPQMQRIDKETSIPRGTTDRKGRKWVCTPEGLLCYDHSNTPTQYTQANTKGFIHNRMLFITELPDGRLLLCNHAHYLGYFNPETHVFQPLNEKLPQLENYRLLIGACPLPQEQKAVVYSQNGAMVLDYRNNRIEEFRPGRVISRYTDKYNCMFLDEHRLWIGTQNGLFVAEGDSVRRLSVSDGLANVCIRSLVQDFQGNMWIGTAAGISRISPQMYITNFNSADGVPSTSMAERAAFLSTDGQLIFDYKDGSVAFRPEWFNAKGKSMPVRLVSVNVNGIPTSYDRKSNSSLQLPYDRNHLDFYMSALNYASPEQTRYRYKLRGIDRDWQYGMGYEGVITVHYNALLPGEYELEAQAAIADSEWGEMLRYGVVILPPWWLTWWAKLTYSLIGFMGLIGLIRLYLRWKKAQMERENEKKVNHLFELREEARHQFAENVNIDPSKISINKEEEELVARLMKAIEKNLDNTDYTVDQLASDVALSRSNLYRRTQSMLGITPNDFLRNVRLKNAARLLSETEQPISQISLQSGFASPRYFAQYFKKMFGITPTEYRQGKGIEGE
ncbi:MAG: helix-turn-helix domain-containing protein [Prevotella sp.]|nr:helix-turn-helix domain-containing protein [Prevotella sp.]